jgi:predicted O-methyltransferase YrrM
VLDLIDWPKSKLDRTGLPERYFHPGELETLVNLIGSIEPVTVIEFGVNEGRTAKAMLRHIPSIRKYVGIDVLPGYVTAKTVQRREIPDRPGHLAQDERAFELILRTRGSLDLIADDLPECDAVFIDGDHGAEAVRHDTALAMARTRSGGLIVWHDYHDLGTVDVKAVLDLMASEGHPIKLIAGTWLAFERR